MFLKRINESGVLEIAQFNYLQEGWDEITQEELNIYILQKAKEAKLKELKDFIFKKKNEPFQKLKAPEVKFNSKGEPYSAAPVNFRFYNGTLPNSTIKSIDLINSIGLDYLQAINNILFRLLTLQLTDEQKQAIINAPVAMAGQTPTPNEIVTHVGRLMIQATSLFKGAIQKIYMEELQKGLSLYPCEIVRQVTNEAGEVEQVVTPGIVNIFPIVFDLKKHLEQRERVENRLLAQMTATIDKLTDPQEILALTFE